MLVSISLELLDSYINNPRETIINAIVVWADIVDFIILDIDIEILAIIYSTQQKLIFWKFIISKKSQEIWSLQTYFFMEK